MKKLLLTLSAVLIFGTAAAQTDTTQSKKTIKTKKTETMVKKKDGRNDSKVTRTNTTQTTDTINRSTNPIPKPKDVAPEPDNPKITDPTKPE